MLMFKPALAVPGSMAREERGALRVNEFKALASRIWQAVIELSGHRHPVRAKQLPTRQSLEYSL